MDNLTKLIIVEMKSIVFYFGFYFKLIWVAILTKKSANKQRYDYLILLGRIFNWKILLCVLCFKCF
ncbi:hypothetical protein B6A10_03145 [Flavobacterium sp. L1I52]|uniref:Uncharacterized protein n=1 Tax=Flavobacterium pokkalii TaxID=1940408 RepID=A0ABR7UNK2_9FLAO|nr:hypothetical protein [Flavobacterium pokkalii]